jgi:hypothetical protein
MPFLLKDRDFSSELGSVRSALIVPCRFCPAASLAVRERAPYMEPFRRLFRTGSYESHVRALKSRLEGEGIRTRVFDSKLLHQFVVCMWTSARRQRLARDCRAYDAVVVLGCDAAVEAVRRCAASSGCQVISAMEVEGIMNVTPTVHFPLTIRLEVTSVTRVLQ